MKVKRIDIGRFMYLKDNIALLNMMVHLPKDEESEVVDYKELTSEIKLLRKAVKRFERRTGISIEVK